MSFIAMAYASSCAFALSSNEKCGTVPATKTVNIFPDAAYRTKSVKGCTNAYIVDIKNYRPETRFRPKVTIGHTAPTSKSKCESFRLAVYAWNSLGEIVASKWRWASWDVEHNSCQLPTLDLSEDLNISIFEPSLRLAFTARQHVKPKDARSKYYRKKARLFKDLP